MYIGGESIEHIAYVGWRVNDSHAEVLARRSFRRYVHMV